MRSEDTLRQEAWIGDAVLSLFAREHILEEITTIDAERESRMTNNPFLSGLGKPIQVEATIGQIYQKEGLEAAFAYIEATILPHFRKQELKRAKGRRGSSR